MSKKHPRHLLVLSTTTILTLLLSVPAFAADGGACSRDPSGAFVDEKGNPLNEEQITRCLNQLAPAAGGDEGGGESDNDQNGDYDDGAPGTPTTDNETPPPDEDTTDGDTPPDEDTTDNGDDDNDHGGHHGDHGDNDHDDNDHGGRGDNDHDDNDHGGRGDNEPT